LYCADLWNVNLATTGEKQSNSQPNFKPIKNKYYWTTWSHYTVANDEWAFQQKTPFGYKAALRNFPDATFPDFDIVKKYDVKMDDGQVYTGYVTGTREDEGSFDVRDINKKYEDFGGIIHRMIFWIGENY
jgi:hypothetical protein